MLKILITCAILVIPDINTGSEKIFYILHKNKKEQKNTIPPCGNMPGLR